MRGSVIKRGKSWTYELYLGRDAAGKKRQKWVGGFRTRHWLLALDLASSAIRRLLWAGNQVLCAAMLNIVAGAIAASDAESAARLQGAARALVTVAVPVSDTPARAPDESGDRSEPVSQPSGGADFVTDLRRHTTGTLRDTLGAERLRELRAEGAAMDFDHAVAYAIDTIDTAQHQAPD